MPQEPIFNEKFEEGEVDNELEEDIDSIQNINFSNMAISGTDWTVETIVNQ